MFKPGDKVMVVNTKTVNPLSDAQEHDSGVTERPEFGRIYVVSDCWETSIGSQVWLIGMGALFAPIINGFKTGWRAENFRKLEEIKASVELRRQSLGHLRPGEVFAKWQRIIDREIDRDL